MSTQRHDLGRPLLALALVGVVLLALVGCRQAASGDPVMPRQVPPEPDDREYWVGTAKMQRELDCLIARVPSTSGKERIDLGRQIVAFGEPAKPKLVCALQAPHPDTRSTAAWLLGFFRDPRTAGALSRATSDPDPLTSFEAAASLVRMKDPRGLGRLIDGLEDTDPRIRAKCIRVLEEFTGETFGFQPDDAPVERAAAVSRWRAWANRGRPGRGP